MDRYSLGWFWFCVSIKLRSSHLLILSKKKKKGKLGKKQMNTKNIEYIVHILVDLGKRLWIAVLIVSVQ